MVYSRRGATSTTALLLGLVVLVACSAKSRHKVLSVFFDGVPDPSEAGRAAAAPPPALVPAVPPSAKPEPPFPGTSATPPLMEKPVLTPRAPLEAIRTWNAALAALPVGEDGGVDWMRAAQRGLIRPAFLPLPGSDPEPPYTLDTLVRAGSRFQERPLFDLDLQLVPEEKPFFAVRFPHAAHTFWLACSSCHPKAGAMRTEMDRILAGEACGKCHGRVAFEPEIACARCHEKLRPGPESDVRKELTRALASPMATTPELLARGRELYGEYCEFCHGEKGDGGGRLAPLVEVKPRDFTSGKYKFRSTIGSTPPADVDLFRTITTGVPGTSMPAWHALPYEDRWALVHFIKTFSEGVVDAEPVAPITIPQPPPITDALIASGRELYRQAGCHSCHGDTGGGDGPSAATLVDDWGNPVPPFNFASGRPLKSGSTISDLYRIVMTGLPGTPMPGFGEVLEPQMAWALASYVESLRGTSRNPFAVKGDVLFERMALPSPEPAGGSEAGEESATALVPPEDELFLLAGKDIPPATFPHWLHRVRFKCSSCHSGIFEMEAGANQITMSAMRRGRYCASCHNGKVAWEVAFTTCVRCHAAR